MNSLSLSLSLKLIVARLISKQNKREIKCVKEALMKGLCLIRTIATDKPPNKRRRFDFGFCPEGWERLHKQRIFQQNNANIVQENRRGDRGRALSNPGYSVHLNPLAPARLQPVHQ